MCVFIFSAQPVQASIWYLDDEAALYIDEALPDWTVIDLGQFDHDFVEINGPLQIGGEVGEDVILESYAGGPFATRSPGSGETTEAPPLSVGNGVSDLGANGVWNKDRNGYIAMTGAGGISVTFEEPVTGLGFFVNGATDDDFFPRIPVSIMMSSGLGSGFMALATVDMDPGSINDGLFFGIHSNLTPISRLDLEARSLVLDDIKFTREPFSRPTVPEPATIVLAGSGLLAAFLFRRKNIGSRF